MWEIARTLESRYDAATIERMEHEVPTPDEKRSFVDINSS